MYLLFDEAGKLLAARVLSQTDTSYQVELLGGKRVKIKSANALLTFEQPTPDVLMTRAQETSNEIDAALAWEFAPSDEFGFVELAQDYFSTSCPITEQVAMLMSLLATPHYFRRAGKGRFKKASAEVVGQALAAIEKRKQMEAQIVEWAEDLKIGRCPEPIANNLYKILFRPDKNASDYKAVVKASRETKLAPLLLLEQAGAITSPYQFHYQRFISEFFPKGEEFPDVHAPPITDELPMAMGVEAFSIDDASTTEIDDALSVQGLGTGQVTLGIHIAAPALAIQPQDDVDNIAKQRMSTVYMPGHKITMLPDAVVDCFTLKAHHACPAVSLYVTMDEETLAIQNHRTAIERVPIHYNLRIEHIEHIVTDAWLAEPTQPSSATDATHADDVLIPLHKKFSFLYRLALKLKATREAARGKPETFTHPSYTFRIHKDPNVTPCITGDERVDIGIRQRGSPIDLIVAECMILANSTWGAWLRDINVPAIYRSQANLGAGAKVRMGSKALPHAGIGVPCYAWSTSPLRRYTDLVNQWQIIACVKSGSAAALVAPFKPKDATLFGIITAFEMAYTSYNSFQHAIERYWVLKYIAQQTLEELTATVVKDNLVRAEQLPLVFPVLGASQLIRGSRVRVKLGQINLISLEIFGTVVEKFPPLATTYETDVDESSDETLDNCTGAIELAMDVSDNDEISLIEEKKQPVTAPEEAT